METLPHEVLRQYIDNIYDYGALRLTCRYYSGFTADFELVWKTQNGYIVDENFSGSVSSLLLYCGGTLMNVNKYWNDRPAMGRYLALSAAAGSEYTLWMCSISPQRVQPEIVKIAAARYTYRVAVGSRTAVYIKTTELVARMFTPAAEYFDVFW